MIIPLITVHVIILLVGRLLVLFIFRLVLVGLGVGNVLLVVVIVLIVSVLTCIRGRTYPHTSSHTCSRGLTCPHASHTRSHGHFFTPKRVCNPGTRAIRTCLVLRASEATTMSRNAFVVSTRSHNRRQSIHDNLMSR